MDFFEHQKRARRRTGVLVALYAAAVVAIVAAVDALLWFGLGPQFDGLGGTPRPAALHLFAIGVTLAVIVGGTLVRIVRLAGGGEAVAAMTGARRVAPDTRDPLERRLLNVVEEMAIASGTAVPGVYVLDQERAINAFAAGYQPNSAIVAVTRGTLEKLDRDELQGVVGHEFSHILNGDMRLNVRMLGVLFGITVVGGIGRAMMRGAGRSGSSRSSSSRGSGHAGIFFLGLGLWLIGAIGVFFARLIKAAVSREREFLADASSVQFTRNPDGIAGALDRIAATGAGTLIDGRYAEEMSHMFFGQSVRMFFAGLFDTHPALDERIRRVRPGFQRGAYRARRAQDDAAAAADAAASRSGAEPAPAPVEAPGDADPYRFGGASALAAPATPGGTEAAAGWDVPPGAVAAAVGNPRPVHVRYAQDLLDTLPPVVRMMTADPIGARALALALVLDADPGARAVQIATLREAGGAPLAGPAEGAAEHLRALDAAHVLPLLDLATPALRRLAPDERRTLLELMRTAVEADRRVTLREFVLLTIARRRLDAGQGRAEPTGRLRAAALREEIVLLISLLAHAGDADDTWSGLAFDCGMTALGLGRGAVQRPRGGMRLEEVSRALLRLRSLAPGEKSRLLEACARTVAANERVTLAEAELVRMIASELDCPIPPLVAGSVREAPRGRAAAGL